MDEEDEDDIYAPDEGTALRSDAQSGSSNPAVKNEGEKNNEDEEEGEEVEEEESDSDIDIITERKGDQKTESVQPPRTNALKVAAPLKTLTVDQAPIRRGSPAIKAEVSTKEREAHSRPGSSYPAVKISSLDVDANPVYQSNGKPITEVDMDSDFPEDDKPWRRPGTDMTDYFNYGFDEFTWASYCLKQTNMRKEVTDSKKQMEEMQNFLTMPGGIPPMPGMAAEPGGGPPGMPSMGGPSDLPPEMQQMMQQMMAQGIDPMQMDPATVMQMMQQGAGGAGGESSQNFGGQGYGQQGQSQLHMGYGGGGGGGGGGYGGGGGGGRNAGGRGQGRRW